MKFYIFAFTLVYKECYSLWFFLFTGLSSLIRDLRYDTFSENRQHDANPYRPSLHSQNKRYDGFGLPANIKGNLPPPDFLADIGHIDRDQHILPHNFPRPLGGRPEFLNYDWNYKGSESINRQVFPRL